METKDLAEGEKKQAQEELKQRELELQRAQEQHFELEKKLNSLNSQVL